MQLPITRMNYQVLWSVSPSSSIRTEAYKIISRSIFATESANTSVSCQQISYGIIYKLQGNEIVVVAVAHLHRKPEY